MCEIGHTIQDTRDFEMVKGALKVKSKDDATKWNLMFEISDMVHAFASSAYEPSTLHGMFKATLNRQNVQEWQEDIKIEYDYLIEDKTWTLVHYYIEGCQL